MKKGIAVAGSLIVDTHYAVPLYPAEGHLTEISDVHTDVGGTGNLILDLAKLDGSLPVKVSGFVGYDEAGEYILSSFAPYANIDTANITREGKTATTLVMDAHNTKQRTFFHFPGANNVYGERYIDWNALNADIFQLEYLLLMQKLDEADSEYGTHAAKILCQAQKRGLKTSIDMVSRHGAHVQPISTCGFAVHRFLRNQRVGSDRSYRHSFEYGNSQLKRLKQPSKKSFAHSCAIRRFNMGNYSLCRMQLRLRLQNGKNLYSFQPQFTCRLYKGKNGSRRCILRGCFVRSIYRTAHNRSDEAGHRMRFVFPFKIKRNRRLTSV